MRTCIRLTWNVLLVAGTTVVGSGLAHAAQWDDARDDAPPTLNIMDVPPSTDGPFVAKFKFTEPVNDFGVDDIKTDNAKLSDFKGHSDSYQVTVTPEGKGNVKITVTAHTAKDMAGNTGPVNEVSATASLRSTKKSPLSQPHKKTKETVDNMKMIAGIIDADDASNLRKKEAGNIDTTGAKLLVGPPRISKEDEDFLILTHK